MRQVLREIPQRFQDKFASFHFSLGRLRGMSDAPPETRQFPVEFGELLESALPRGIQPSPAGKTFTNSFPGIAGCGIARSSC